MNVKEESEKPGLKSLIQNTKIMTLSPVTSWQIDGKTTESVTGFLFLASKITENGDSNHEVESCLFLRRKAMTHLNSMLKSGDITVSNGPYSQSYGFSSSHVWM